MALNIYAGSSYPVGSTLYTDGNVTFGYQAVTPVNLAGGNPINVTLAYNAANQTLSEQLVEQNTSNSFSTTYTGVNLSSDLGGATGYVGFTGGSGGSTATQEISNFTFIEQAYQNGVTVSGTSSISVPAGASASLNGVISGGGSLTTEGGGTLILYGDNTYSGGTTISSGTLEVANGGSLGYVSASGRR